jgi:hypothetical protein
MGLRDRQSVWDIRTDSQYGIKGQTFSMGYRDRQSVWDLGTDSKYGI